MRYLSAFLVLVVCVATGIAQPNPRRVAPIAHYDTASTTWDSVYVGGSHSKNVDIYVPGTTDSLFIAEENDTTAGRIGWLKAGISYRIELTTSRWIRTKTSTGTIFRIIWATVPIVRS